MFQPDQCKTNLTFHYYSFCAQITNEKEKQRKNENADICKTSYESFYEDVNQ